MKNAIKSYKATLIQELSKGGEEELAKIVLKLFSYFMRKKHGNNFERNY